MPHPEALPHFENAIIPPSKLLGYALNPNHPRGRAKARVFASALGFNAQNWEALVVAVLAELSRHPAIRREIRPHGSEFTVDIPVTGPGGSATVRSGRILEAESRTPRLTTIYVKRQQHV